MSNSFVVPWNVVHQAPLFMEFPRQEYCSGLPFPSPEDLDDPGIELASLLSPALAGGFFTPEPLGKSNTLNIEYMSFFFFFFKIYLFIVALGLCCCTRAFSTYSKQGCSSLWCSCFSLQWLLLLWSSGSRHRGFSSRVTQA